MGAAAFVLAQLDVRRNRTGNANRKSIIFPVFCVFCNFTPIPVYRETKHPVPSLHRECYHTLWLGLYSFRKQGRCVNERISQRVCVYFVGLFDISTAYPEETTRLRVTYGNVKLAPSWDDHSLPKRNVADERTWERRFFSARSFRWVQWYGC